MDTNYVCELIKNKLILYNDLDDKYKNEPEIFLLFLEYDESIIYNYPNVLYVKEYILENHTHYFYIFNEDELKTLYKPYISKLYNYFNNLPDFIKLDPEIINLVKKNRIMEQLLCLRKLGYKISICKSELLVFININNTIENIYFILDYFEFLPSKLKNDLDIFTIFTNNLFDKFSYNNKDKYYKIYEKSINYIKSDKKIIKKAFFEREDMLYLLPEKIKKNNNFILKYIINSKNFDKYYENTKKFYDIIKYRIKIDINFYSNLPEKLQLDLFIIYEQVNNYNMIFMKNNVDIPLIKYLKDIDFCENNIDFIKKIIHINSISNYINNVIYNKKDIFIEYIISKKYNLTMIHKKYNNYNLINNRKFLLFDANMLKNSKIIKLDYFALFKFNDYKVLNFKNIITELNLNSIFKYF